MSRISSAGATSCVWCPCLHLVSLCASGTACCVVILCTPSLGLYVWGCERGAGGRPCRPGAQVPSGAHRVPAERAHRARSSHGLRCSSSLPGLVCPATVCRQTVFLSFRVALLVPACHTYFVRGLVLVVPWSPPALQGRMPCRIWQPCWLALQRNGKSEKPCLSSPPLGSPVPTEGTGVDCGCVALPWLDSAA